MYGESARAAEENAAGESVNYEAAWRIDIVCVWMRDGSDDIYSGEFLGYSFNQPASDCRIQFILPLMMPRVM